MRGGAFFGQNDLSGGAVAVIWPSSVESPVLRYKEERLANASRSNSWGGIYSGSTPRPINPFPVCFLAKHLLVWKTLYQKIAQKSRPKKGGKFLTCKGSVKKNMKIDRHLSSVALTRNQAYFASCWFNMVHEYSLDSFRVRAMNPRNVLRELDRIYQLGKTDERGAVRAEAHKVLDADKVLRAPPFATATEKILKLTEPEGVLSKNKEDGEAKILLSYFVAELVVFVDRDYIPAALDRIGSMVSPTNAVAPEPDRFEEIYVATGFLLSTLIDKKASIESLYTLYSEILVPRRLKPGYKFQRRFDLLKTLLTASPSEHLVAFSLENVTSPQSFPTKIGGITFTVNPPFVVMPIGPSPSAEATRKYLAPSNRRLFASTTISAQDPRTAGTEAAEMVSQILNLVRFEYERAKVTMPEIFAFVRVDRPGDSPRIFSLPAVVPNPTVSIDGDGLALFVASVNELVLEGRFSMEGRDRVQAAFRLYRTGLDTNILENKLVNWWTAIEYLVRGNHSVGGIGNSVETMLTPVLCNAYVAKHLFAQRVALLEIGAALTDPVTGEKITLRGMSIDKMYGLFKRTDIQATILAAIGQHVLVHKQFEYFFQGLNDPKVLHKRNQEHEQRLRWHLQRIWRARCDIVHSGERAVSAALLCANLEYYLKTTLMALLKSLRDVSTLGSPKEFFDRQSHSYESLQADLKVGHDQVLLGMLAS